MAQVLGDLRLRRHAVAMLGINLLSEIAFTASLKAGAFQVPGHEDDVKQLWSGTSVGYTPTLVVAYGSSGYRDAIAFVAIIVVLLILSSLLLLR